MPPHAQRQRLTSCLPATGFRWLWLAIALLAWLVPPALANEPANVQRLIVRLRADAGSAAGPGGSAAAVTWAARASALSGQVLTSQQRLSTGAHLIHLPAAMTADAARAMARQLAQDPAVLSVEPDLLLQPQGLLFGGTTPAPAPTGYQGYANQWYFGTPGSSEPTAIGLRSAINTAQGGSAALTVAVLDTGLLAHPDLGGANSSGTRYVPGGRFLPGYNFTGADRDYAYGSCQPPAGSYVFSNTAVSPQPGRAPDATDTGNWVDGSVRAGPAGCLLANAPDAASDWHGTEMTSIIAASTDALLRFDGINQNSQVLPVRVAARGGAYLSDIIEAAYWAAGQQTAALAAQGVARNPWPAQVINVSLGATGACSPSWQDALNAILAPAGPVKAVVVAAGNEGAGLGALAACQGAVVVGAVNRKGQRSSFSNTGSGVTLSAPGGDCSNGSANGCVVNPADAVYALGNSGSTMAVTGNYTSLWNVVGTSPATSLVTGVVSLMLSANPALTPGQVISTLQASARAFPAGSGCTTTLCGAGLLDAGAAVDLARNPPPAASATPPAVGGSSAPNSAASGATQSGISPASSAGSSGGGGCAFSGQAPVDPLLPLLPVLFLFGRPLRRQVAALATTMQVRSMH